MPLRMVEPRTSAARKGSKENPFIVAILDGFGSHGLPPTYFSRLWKNPNDLQHPTIDGATLTKYMSWVSKDEDKDGSPHGFKVLSVLINKERLYNEGKAEDKQMHTKYVLLNADLSERNYKTAAEDQARGIRWAVEIGADALNTSYRVPYTHSPEIVKAMNMAENSGLKVFMSSGNRDGYLNIKSAFRGRTKEYLNFLNVGGTTLAGDKWHEGTINKDLVEAVQPFEQIGKTFGGVRERDLIAGTSYSSPAELFAWQKDMFEEGYLKAGQRFVRKFNKGKYSRGTLVEAWRRRKHDKAMAKISNDLFKT